MRADFGETRSQCDATEGARGETLSCVDDNVGDVSIFSVDNVEDSGAWRFDWLRNGNSLLFDTVKEELSTFSIAINEASAGDSELNLV